MSNSASAKYEGESKNGMKHGKGVLTWEDGEQVYHFFYIRNVSPVMLIDIFIKIV